MFLQTSCLIQLFTMASTWRAHTHKHITKTIRDTQVSHASQASTPKTTCDTHIPTKACGLRLATNASTRRAHTQTHIKDHLWHCMIPQSSDSLNLPPNHVREEHVHQRITKTIRDTHVLTNVYLAKSSIKHLRLDHLSHHKDHLWHPCSYKRIVSFHCHHGIYRKSTHTHHHITKTIRDTTVLINVYLIKSSV